jgi:penicillin-binding protein 1B
MSRRTQILLLALVAVLALTAGAVLVGVSAQHKISQRLEKGWVLPPLELYSQGFPLSPGRHISAAALESEVRAHGLTPDRDFTLGPVDACARLTGLSFKDTSQSCLYLKNPALVVAWDEHEWITELWTGAPLAPTTTYSLFPRLITQFYDGQPILQQNTPLSEIPLACLQGVTAIEDPHFLEHKGVSFIGTLRAVARNLRNLKYSEGGSTITQQLVKNFFLTPKKTIRRKLEEQVLAIMLEAQLSKDQIFEMYLNVIYMGQSGPFQVRGFGSAAPFYFDKPVAQLNLPECALLAAIVNSPGRFSPFEHADNARTRRDKVLHKMNELSMIDDNELTLALSAPLPHAPDKNKRINAPYYVMSALKEFQSWGVDSEEGARLYTALDPDVQAQIADSAARLLPEVEKRIKKPSKQPLQVAVMTVDLLNSQILGLVGGRDYRTTQYNRATDSRRQIGSVVKPFVYWPALKDNSPLTAVVDEPFEWKVGKQVWKPKNYEKGNEGPVPYFYALAESLNVPAAKVGQLVGLDKVADTIRKSGIRTEVPVLPSLTLGAFELSLSEVAQGYSTLARMGHGDDLHTLLRAEDTAGNVIFTRQPSTELELDPVVTGVLIGMMEQTFSVGTARAARAWGLEGPYAGKTGTTSDTKDAWFAGFNGRLLSVVWVGYDDNTVMGLTGAGAALPIWVDLSKKLQSIYKPEDFHWPPGVERRPVPREELLKQFPALKNLPEQLELTFANWAS